jgi:hypothetical protein
MATLKITAKGQVTLRRDILRHLGVAPGEQVVVDMLPDGALLVRAARPKGKIADVFSMLKRDGRKPLSIDEIGRLAAEGWGRRR